MISCQKKNLFSDPNFREKRNTGKSKVWNFIGIPVIMFKGEISGGGIAVCHTA